MAFKAILIPHIPFLQMPELEFTESELEAVTMVFKQYETGLREACIDVKVGPSSSFN